MSEPIIPDVTFTRSPLIRPGLAPFPGQTPPSSPASPSPVPSSSAPSASGGVRPRRSLDRRRTPAPEPGPLPATRGRHLLRYGVAPFDSDGRLRDAWLFGVLGWEAGTRVDVGVTDGHALVARRSASGGSRLTGRGMLLVPAAVRQWCGFAAGERVLLVAVPLLSALVVHGLERLDLALPDPRSLVDRMRAVGEYPVQDRPAGARSPARPASAQTPPFRPSPGVSSGDRRLAGGPPDDRASRHGAAQPGSAQGRRGAVLGGGV